MKMQIKAFDNNLIEAEPYYLPSSHEVEVFSQSFYNQLPVLSNTWLGGCTDR